MTPDPTEQFPEPIHQPVMSVTEFTGLVSLISGMLSAMEARIMDRLADNSRLASERWARHDEEARRLIADWDRRVSALEARVDEHHHAAEIEHVTWDARISPVRNSAKLIAANWKTIMLIAFGVLGFLAIFADLIARYLGLPA